MITLNDVLTNRLKDDTFRKMWNANEIERSIICKIIDDVSNDRITYEALSKKTDISISRIWEILEGEDPTIYELNCLADVAGYKLRLTYA